MITKNVAHVTSTNMPLNLYHNSLRNAMRDVDDSKYTCNEGDGSVPQTGPKSPYVGGGVSAPKGFGRAVRQGQENANKKKKNGKSGCAGRTLVSTTTQVWMYILSNFRVCFERHL